MCFCFLFGLKESHHWKVIPVLFLLRTQVNWSWLFKCSRMRYFMPTTWVPATRHNKTHRGKSEIHEFFMCVCNVWFICKSVFIFHDIYFWMRWISTIWFIIVYDDMTAHICVWESCKKSWLHSDQRGPQDTFTRHVPKDVWGYTFEPSKSLILENMTLVGWISRTSCKGEPVFSTALNVCIWRKPPPIFVSLFHTLIPG